MSRSPLISPFLPLPPLLMCKVMLLRQSSLSECVSVMSTARPLRNQESLVLSLLFSRSWISRWKWLFIPRCYKAGVPTVTAWMLLPFFFLSWRRSFYLRREVQTYANARAEFSFLSNSSKRGCKGTKKEMSRTVLLIESEVWFIAGQLSL